VLVTHISYSEGAKAVRKGFHQGIPRLTLESQYRVMIDHVFGHGSGGVGVRQVLEQKRTLRIDSCENDKIFTLHDPKSQSNFGNLAQTNFRMPIRPRTLLCSTSSVDFLIVRGFSSCSRASSLYKVKVKKVERFRSNMGKFRLRDLSSIGTISRALSCSFHKHS